jgi:hypothetical protein
MSPAANSSPKHAHHRALQLYSLIDVAQAARLRWNNDLERFNDAGRRAPRAPSLELLEARLTRAASLPPRGLGSSIGTSIASWGAYTAGLLTWLDGPLGMWWGTCSQLSTQSAKPTPKADKPPHPPLWRWVQTTQADHRSRREWAARKAILSAPGLSLAAHMKDFEAFIQTGEGSVEEVGPAAAAAPCRKAC